MWRRALGPLLVSGHWLGNTRKAGSIADDRGLGYGGRKPLSASASDQGAQYSCLASTATHHAGYDPQHEPHSDCYDNPLAESFFSTLKNELVYRKTYYTRDEASRKIFAFIEGFYNRQRLHQSLGDLSPSAFEQRISES